jgi:hypothetical protein
MMLVITLIGGLTIGGLAGVFLMAALIAGARADIQMAPARSRQEIGEIAR